MDVRFVDLKALGAFVVPPRAVSHLFPVRFTNMYPLGYRHMCRFFAVQWMHVLRRYTAVMRIDEDVLVHRMGPPFTALVRDNLVYAYAMFLDEGHAETVQTMGVWMDRYTHDRHLRSVSVKKIYFTNVFLTRVDWWLRDDVQSFLRDVDETHNIYIHRWGDAPIQTAAVNLFGRASYFDMDYSHGSTNNEIVHGKEVKAKYRPQKAESAMLKLALKTFERSVAPCVVASVFGMPATTTREALDALRASVMLDAELPKEVVDQLSPLDVARAFQIDVRKSSVPLPTDDLVGLQRLDAIARALHAPKWDDAVMLKKIQEHPCATTETSKARVLLSRAETSKTRVLFAKGGTTPKRTFGAVPKSWNA
jgi:hypothetical protein